MTKEEKKEYNKKYQEKNKERISAKKKVDYQNNKEKYAAYNKVYNEANKEKIAVLNKAYYESKKDGLYTVYHLVNENYVGQTSNLYTRLIVHKSKNGRDVSNVQIIGKYKTRIEAKTVEAEYHSKGYLGYHFGI